MKSLLLSAAFGLTVLAASAETQTVEKFLYTGPYAMQAPVKVDTADFQLRGYDPMSLLDASTPLQAVMSGTEWSGTELPGVPEGAAYALHQLGFTLTNPSYVKGQLKLSKAPAHYQFYLDGKKAAAGDLQLEPGTHQCVIKYLSDATAEHADSLEVTYDLSGVSCTLPGEQKELYTITRMMESRLCYGISVSPKGDYLLITEGQRAPQRNKRWYYLQNRLTGQRQQLAERVEWMPRTNRYYLTREGNEGRELVTVDPATGQEQVLCQHLPEGRFQFAPTEDFLIFSIRQEGPKELNKDVFEVVNPEDRQPGWRDRSQTAIYDLATGVLRPLTFGYSSCWAGDVSQDGRYMLLSKNTLGFPRLGEGTPVDRPQRPHDTSSLYRLDLQTMAVDTLFSGEGFANGGIFSPDGTKVLIQGSPEAFGRIGCTLPDNVTPSMYDYQAYVLDITSREVTPLTRDFNPSVSNMDWNVYDGMIYMTAENKDSVSLYRIDPKDWSIRMIPLPEENVKGIALAANAPVMAWYGQSAMNSDRLYTADLSKVKADKKNSGLLTVNSQLLEDISAQTLANIQVAQCKSWTFRNSNGDDVLCRYYLPVGFDEGDNLASSIVNRESESLLPMITYYYGGCSPTERSFESSYPWQCWAALGYAVLVVEPSGAAGFGQEWASRHVNTAGVDPARDITEAVREFCRTHAYINKEKVGCCGASYGGFMTQYLQTLPDCPFACAISHAGISDHTPYWGYGYWGYSYSEVSMANSYPWSETDLYVKNSPIYRVDQIHTPILFLHGTKDVNVPINNSIQMFTALKLLGRETALVCVEGEDHGIVDYDKRLAWLRTSLAWFQKYLKDDSSWWDAMYPKKNL